MTLPLRVALHPAVAGLSPPAFELYSELWLRTIVDADAGWVRRVHCPDSPERIEVEAAGLLTTDTDAFLRLRLENGRLTTLDYVLVDPTAPGSP